MRYRVKALQDGQGVTALTLDAADESDAARQAASRGYAVLAIRPQQSWRALRLKRGMGFPLALFSQELLTLLEAGLSLVEAMETLAEKEPRPEVRKILRQIIGTLYEGHPLSYGLQQSSAGFPPLYIATVHASEKTGDLAEALARYVAYHEQMDIVRKKIVSASLYPLLLIGAGGLVAAFLMVYVVPRFTRIYEDLGSVLPLSSRLLMNWGKLLETHAVPMLASVAAFHDEEMARWVDWFTRLFEPLLMAVTRIRPAFTWHLAHRADIAAFLARHEETMRAMDSVLRAEAQAARSGPEIEDLSIKTISEDTSPVVKLVHSTLYDALKTGASDIHLETGPGGLSIKYRIDGVLCQVGTMQGLDQAEQVISRVKVVSELDIAERRVPQDGRFKVSMRGREVDFRVSVMPSIFGEDAVLRILDKQALTDQIRGLRLDYLGFDEPTLRLLRRLANEPYGMVLVTGPTGSGKTTTLYAAISEINRGQDKIITIEDPVEYQLPGVLQIPVNEKKGLTFARGLRSILRHDPDKIMVGEIRDPETAQIAVQSALTGHLVFTTVHANNVFDVIGRFTHMGVDPYAFVSALNGILAQRLVRLNCPHCAAEAVPNEQLLHDSGITPEQATDFHFRAGLGCGQCRGTSFKGRKAVAETLRLTDEIRELIVAREPIRRVKEAARCNGMRFLREAALDLVKSGETTLQEINRVTFVA